MHHPLATFTPKQAATANRPLEKLALEVQKAARTN
jgi:hypothetical protein